MVISTSVLSMQRKGVRSKILHQDDVLKWNDMSTRDHYIAENFTLGGIQQSLNHYGQ
jgi:hypothetical protein